MKILQNNFTSIVAIYFLATVCAMLSFLNFEVVTFSLALPLFDVMMVYYFRVFRRVFSLWFVFFLGLITDSLSGEILGLTSLIYIVLIKSFEYVEARMAIKDEFEQVLRRFLVFLSCFLFSKWLILSIIHYSNYSFWVLIIQFIISSICYIFVHKFLDNYYAAYLDS